MSIERGIPFNEHIMEEELPAHFRAPFHLPAYDGTTDPAEHIRMFENAALLYRYTDGVKCRVFLNTLTNSAQQWFNQLPAGSIISFAEFSSLFQHQFASSKKYQKLVISLFGIKQEEKKTLKREYGHDTNRYRQLRQEIERLIRDCYLKDSKDNMKGVSKMKNSLITTAPA
ncbi:hypothetical protein Sango_0259000 [Sesamum angolense]|uniref:Retrotransposon gag domain-containing protein n=1 Tax=Sesamum angolense TaxID=2727404 RepID=A0AAE2C7T3_9LAMI|nr:hypothetical protein Sango_0259000 [Sesamum angolense]